MAEAYFWAGTTKAERFVFTDDRDRFDFVRAGGGNDLISDGSNDGLWSSDVFGGQQGNDTIISTEGHDLLRGGRGHDLFVVTANWYDAADLPGAPNASAPDVRGFDVRVQGGRGHDIFRLIDSDGYSVVTSGETTYITTEFGGTITVRGVEEFQLL